MPTVGIITVETSYRFKLNFYLLKNDLLKKVPMPSFMFFILSFILTLSSAWAKNPLCANLFDKTYPVSEFIISITGKKQSENYLLMAHSNLTSSFEISKVNRILKNIKNSGLEHLTTEERLFVIKIRQNSSFLRSIFQTSSDQHKSPDQFAYFVRDFGILKDYLLMEDSSNAQQMAKKILKKYSTLDFDSLIENIQPASKKSVRKYFKETLKETKKIMLQQIMTVDKVHTVRKNLRDVLRFMQIQFAASSETLDTEQIQFLKKTNIKLGEFCDTYVAQILRGEITDDTLVEFPIQIRPRVDYFLENYKIQVED